MVAFLWFAFLLLWYESTPGHCVHRFVANGQHLRAQSFRGALCIHALVAVVAVLENAMEYSCSMGWRLFVVVDFGPSQPIPFVDGTVVAAAFGNFAI